MDKRKNLAREITHLSLFSGIGGIDLAAEWAGIKTVGQCEWAEYPTKVLEKHWPTVPRWKDIRTLTGKSFYEKTNRRTVDIISGGFPCQPFSVAGKQRGKEDDRYLWPEMVRVIKELRPTWVVGENVAGIIRMALPDILSELEACGYRTRVFHIPASGVGARHHRYRVAIVAHADSCGQLYRQNEVKSAKGWEQTQCKSERRREDMAHSYSDGERNCRDRGGICDEKRNREEKESGRKFFEHGIECNRKNVAYAESKFKRRLPFREESEKSRFSLGGKNVGDSHSAGLQKERTKQQTTGFTRTSKDVQHSNGTGCEEQHVSAESDKEGFAGWGCNAGASTFPNTNNGSGGVRRHGKLPEIKEAEGEGDNIRGRAQEHESGEWRTAESVLGGMADGLSPWMDRNLEFFINHYWDDEPNIPRIATGIEHRVDRLKCLGNAVVPQQFYPIFRAIAETEKGENKREKNERGKIPDL